MANMIELAVLPVHERMAELHDISRNRFLTDKEDDELQACLQVNADVMREICKIKLISDAACIVNDTEWQHEICARIEKVSKRFVPGGIICG